jgi:hypothetical protein
MPRLDWKRHETGWRAGRYYIEKLAPDVWACSRMRSGVPVVEMLADSKRQLQEGIEMSDRKVRSTRRAFVYAVAFTVFVVLTAQSTSWESRTAAAVTLLTSLLATFCFVGIIEAWVSRTWRPPPRLPYQ